MFDWTRLEQPVRVKVELDKPLMERRERGKLVQGDENANAIVAEVYQTDGVPYDLTGSTVTLTFVRPDNLAAPPITAEIVGDGNNIAVATLTDTCYRYSGMYAASLKIAKGVVERTIVRILGDVVSTENSGVVDDEVLFPSPEDLLETLAQVETARQNAEAAAARANAGAERVEQLAIDASGLAGDALKLGGKPPEHYLPVQNLFINPELAIAQAGYNGLYGEELYAADRWHSDSGITVSKTKDGFTLANTGSYWHRVKQKLCVKTGETYTFAVRCKTLNKFVLSVIDNNNTVIDQKGFDGDGNYNNYVLTFSANTEAITCRLAPDHSFSGSPLEGQWFALYPGTYTADTLPPVVPRPYAEELAECRRYYRRSYDSEPLSPYGAHRFIPVASVGDTQAVNFDTPMAGKPTIIVKSWGDIGNNAIRDWKNSVDVPIRDVSYVTPHSFNIVYDTALVVVGGEYAFHYEAIYEP